MAKYLKILRDYNGFKKDSEQRVADNVADFLLSNSIASLSSKNIDEPCADCPEDEADCEDCKSKKKKKAPAKKRVVKKSNAKKSTKKK